MQKQNSKQMSKRNSGAVTKKKVMVEDNYFMIPGNIPGIIHIKTINKSTGIGSSADFFKLYNLKLIFYDIS